MGKSLSKRSVDITTDASKKTADNSDELPSGKVEKLDESAIAAAPVATENGDTVTQDNGSGDAAEKPDVSENDKDATTEKSGDEKIAATVSAITENSENSTPNAAADTSAIVATSAEGEETPTNDGIAPLADDADKGKSKKKKIVKKWSLKSTFSFGKKDKQKPAKSAEAAPVAVASNGDVESPAEAANTEAEIPATAAAVAAENGGEQAAAQINGDKTPTTTTPTANETKIEIATTANEASQAATTTTIEPAAEKTAPTEIVADAAASATVTSVAAEPTAISIVNGDAEKEPAAPAAIAENHNEERTIPNDEQKEPHLNGLNGDVPEEIAAKPAEPTNININQNKTQIEEIIVDNDSSIKTPDENSAIADSKSSNTKQIQQQQLQEQQNLDKHSPCNETEGLEQAVASNTNTQDSSAVSETQTNADLIEKTIGDSEQLDEDEPPSQPPPPLPTSLPPSQVSVFALSDDNLDIILPRNTSLSNVSNISFSADTIALGGTRTALQYQHPLIAENEINIENFQITNTQTELQLQPEPKAEPESEPEQEPEPIKVEKESNIDQKITEINDFIIVQTSNESLNESSIPQNEPSDIERQQNTEEPKVIIENIESIEQTELHIESPQVEQLHIEQSKQEIIECLTKSSLLDEQSTLDHKTDSEFEEQTTTDQKGGDYTLPAEIQTESILKEDQMRAIEVKNVEHAKVEQETAATRSTVDIIVAPTTLLTSQSDITELLEDISPPIEVDEEQQQTNILENKEETTTSSTPPPLTLQIECKTSELVTFEEEPRVANVIESTEEEFTTLPLPTNESQTVETDLPDINELLRQHYSVKTESQEDLVMQQESQPAELFTLDKEPKDLLLEHHQQKIEQSGEHLILAEQRSIEAQIEPKIELESSTASSAEPKQQNNLFETDEIELEKKNYSLVVEVEETNDNEKSKAAIEIDIIEGICEKAANMVLDELIMDLENSETNNKPQVNISEATKEQDEQQQQQQQQQEQKDEIEIAQNGNEYRKKTAAAANADTTTTTITTDNVATKDIASVKKEQLLSESIADNAENANITTQELVVSSE